MEEDKSNEITEEQLQFIEQIQDQFQVVQNEQIGSFNLNSNTYQLDSQTQQIQQINNQAKIQEDLQFEPEFQDCPCCQGYITSCKNQGKVCKDLGACYCVYKRQFEENDFQENDEDHEEVKEQEENQFY